MRLSQIAIFLCNCSCFISKLFSYFVLNLFGLGTDCLKLIFFSQKDVLLWHQSLMWKGTMDRASCIISWAPVCLWYTSIDIGLANQHLVRGSQVLKAADRKWAAPASCSRRPWPPCPPAMSAAWLTSGKIRKNKKINVLLEDCAVLHFRRRMAVVK